MPAFSMLIRRACLSLCVVLLLITNHTQAADEAWLFADSFLREHCADCHSGGGAEADLDLQALQQELSSPANFRVWVKVHDRVQAGEMPPADAEQPTAADRQAFVKRLGEQLQTANRQKQTAAGRVQFRRLNRVEYENSLRDLLGLPFLEVRDMLPPDNSAQGFDNVGSALDVSYVQLARYLEASDLALTQAMQLGPKPVSETRRLEARTNGRFRQVLGKATEAQLIGNAVGLFRQPNTAQAPWWWSKCDPPRDGMYRLKMKTFGCIWDKGEVLPADRTHAVTFHAVQQTSKRPLGTFDVGRSAEQATIHDFHAYLKQGDQIQIWFETLDDRNKQKTPWDKYTAPGVAIEWLEMEGPLVEEWPPASYRSLFGDLPTEVWTPATGLVEPPLPVIVDGVGKRAKQVTARRNRTTLYHVVSAQPQTDAARLLRQFGTRAFRRPVQDADIADILSLVNAKLAQKLCFQEALKTGYQAVLCSPEFLFLQERPGRLDDYALAARLSYFLWNSLPDDALLASAAAGKLHEPAVLKQHVERMLHDPRSSRFVENFTGQWLDLRRITITQPDEQLYPEYDQLLLDSMVAETRAYFAEMLQQNLGVSHLVDSDFAMLNERLAQHYEIPGVDGVAIRKVPLPKDSVRGGLLTQASLLKVTANGTTTSPVTRGAWVLDRIYGQPAPLPPPNVPAVEPDVRGTTTIRDQLDKHRADVACAGCHQKIDPPGFALESFDVIGGYRQRYRALEKGDNPMKTVKNNRPVRYKLGLPVDSTGTTPNGRAFRDIEEFRTILLTQEDTLARNLIKRLLVCATGGEIEFADRAVVDDLLQKTAPEQHGLRSLIHAIVQSETFRSK